MEVLGLLILSAVAGAGVLGLLVRLSGPRPGTWASLARFTAVGALSVIPGFFLYGLASGLIPEAGAGRWGLILFVWTVNAPVEEAAKYFSFALASRLWKSIRRPQDGVVQGAATGLGFALVENFLYGLAGGWELLLIRVFLSLPGHVIYGAVWGGYHGFEVYQGRGRIQRAWVPLLALVPAAFAHALFNTLAIAGAPLVLSLAADGAALSLGIFLFTRLGAHDPEARRLPLRRWKEAIPDLDHALALDPGNTALRLQLAAYLLAGAQPDRALEVLGPVDGRPWAQFYRDCARIQLEGPGAEPPASAALNPRLFEALSRP